MQLEKKKYNSLSKLLFTSKQPLKKRKKAIMQELLKNKPKGRT